MRSDIGCSIVVSVSGAAGARKIGATLRTRNRMIARGPEVRGVLALSPSRRERGFTSSNVPST